MTFHRPEPIPTPYLLFLGDVASKADTKTAAGLLEWRAAWCSAQCRLPGCVVDLGLPDMTPAQAARAGLRTLVIGVAPDGGRIPEHWLPSLHEALRAGLNVAAGLHDRLHHVPTLVEAARGHGARLFDVRGVPDGLKLPVGRGVPRSGRRLLTVGTDCAIGKKFTALHLERAMRARGMATDFRATGQTGILISGAGIAIDAVPADFVAGAVEWMSPAAAPEHWDVIEGQGSLFHPAYAGVSLGLLHGAQPDAIVVCTDTRRSRIDGFESFRAPTIEDCIALNLQLGAMTNAAIRCVGISVNTAGMSADERRAALQGVRERFDVPVFDPAVEGCDAVVDLLR
jgi:uncharacterized NAD-dependent epimerase/dehydratase family protein